MSESCRQATQHPWDLSSKQSFSLQFILFKSEVPVCFLLVNVRFDILFKNSIWLCLTSHWQGLNKSFNCDFSDPCVCVLRSTVIFLKVLLEAPVLASILPPARRVKGRCRWPVCSRAAWSLRCPLLEEVAAAWPSASRRLLAPWQRRSPLPFLPEGELPN